MLFSSEFNEFIRRTSISLMMFAQKSPTSLPDLIVKNFSPTTNFRTRSKKGFDIYFHHVYHNINEDSQ